MNYYLVSIRLASGKTDGIFTYQYSENLLAGQIVEVSFGKKSSIGIIIEQTQKPNFITKDIIKIIEQIPLPRHILDTAFWMKDYYQASLSQIWQTMIPAGIQKKRRQLKTKEIKSISMVKHQKIKPTANQSQAISQINSSKSSTIILRGVTGSGKTTVYHELIKQTLAKNQSIIIIVPEISLTSQLINQLQAFQESLIIFHSKISEAKKHLNWQQCLTSDQPLVVLGARSALFSPLKNLGLIIIDEFHENSLKQDKAPRYYAVRVASLMAKKLNIKLLLGSATPPVTDYWIAEQKNSTIVTLSSTALTVTKPVIKIIDMTKKHNFKHSFLSEPLLARIKKSLANNKQTLIFHNRRGSTRATTCFNCGWVASCPNCDIPLSLHADLFKMHCHNCGFKQNAITSCPICNSLDINHRGIGTKLIETELTKIFPTAIVKRFDADNTEDDSLPKHYTDITAGKINIIIGTQILVKGFNLPHLDTVGIIQADTGLFLPDFSSEEKTFQLLSQVIGRVGRYDNPSTVIIQTYHPDNQYIKFGVNQDYINFYNHCLKKRHLTNYPPFVFLLKISVQYKTEATVLKHIKIIQNNIRNNYRQVQILGPMPAFHEKNNQQIVWQLIIKSKQRSILQKIAETISSPHCKTDLDPISLL